MAFIHCCEEDVKRVFLADSDYFYNGYVVKFLDWLPNCNEDNLNFVIPTWLFINPIPPELNQLGIIRRIGQPMGELIGLDASFERCNNLKLSIICKVNKMKLVPIKIITNRSIYNLDIQRYEGKITEIIRINDE